MKNIMGIILFLFAATVCAAHLEGEPNYTSKGKTSELTGKFKIYVWCDNQDCVDVIRNILTRECPKLEVVTDIKLGELILWSQVPGGARISSWSGGVGLSSNSVSASGGIYTRDEQGKIRKLKGFFEDNSRGLLDVGSGDQLLPVTKIARKFIDEWQKYNP